MRSFRLVPLICSLALGALSLASPQPAVAQNHGFSVNRYDPTPAGEWSFWVDHPWYSRTRRFAGGMTLNYAHNPLVLSATQGGVTQDRAVIEHQLIAHVDLAISFLDRITLNTSLPITLLERGNELAGIRPTSGVGVGDPRLGFMLRLLGQPDDSAFSLNLGAQFYIPLRALTGDSSAITPTSSDTGFRALPKLVMAGYGAHIRWSAVAAFLIRPMAILSDSAPPDGNTAGSELQLGALLQYADKPRRFAIGPELMLATVVSEKPFTASYTSIEALLTGHYHIAGQVMLGLAAGVGALRQPGTPDARALLRLAYAPQRTVTPPADPPTDQDRDGVPDRDDLCPDEAAGPQPDPERRGCPQRDRDRDQVFDRDDMCPDTHKGPNPDPNRAGCPLQDRDGDGVFDPSDLCPTVPQGDHPDPARPGCPLEDRDHDGVFDPSDLCPDVPQGPVPDPARPGCPAGDRDRDGIPDPRDLCPDTVPGLLPDPDRPGCPAPDRDGDLVPDRTDACPDRPGAPHPDPKKNGCPSLVVLSAGKLVILRPVFFATNRDVILPQSFPVLQAVADALLASPQIKRVRIEGHTDNRGKAEYNVELSNRRALSVQRWLLNHSIAAERISAEGHGPHRPVADNATAKGRATNRRVDFIIVDPAPPAGQPQPALIEPPVTRERAPSADKSRRPPTSR